MGLNALLREGLRWPPPADEFLSADNFSSCIDLPLFDCLNFFINPTVPEVNDLFLADRSAFDVVLGLC